MASSRLTKMRDHHKGVHEVFCDYKVYEGVEMACEIEQKRTHYDVHVGECEWDNEVALIVLFYDVSENVRQSRKIKVAEYKEKILCSVSHNLKTPLNAILLYNENLLLSVNQERQPHYYE